MKLADTSGKKKEYVKAKIYDRDNNSNINIGDLCNGINDYTKDFQPRTNLYGIRRMIWLQPPQYFG
jgi:hypothetical protein